MGSTPIIPTYHESDRKKKRDNMKKIQPVLRYPGSKYRKIDKIIDTLDIKKEDRFLDMFSGSGIVGVNVRHLTNAKTCINDFDDMFPVTVSKAISNMLSFQGLGKNYTKSAFEYFRRRVDNGYWEKLDEYNGVLGECEITKQNWNLIGWNIKFADMNKIYVDPPYDDITGLYKGSYTKQNHIKLKQVLERNFSEDKKILISYNDTPFIRDLYKDWNIQTEEFTYQTGLLNRTNKKAKVNELWITNFKGEL